MAILKSFDFAAARSNTRMPWDVLLDGNIRQLQRVKSAADVKDPTEQFYQTYFAAQVKKYAQAKGIVVNVAGGGPGSETCTLRYIGKVGEAPKATPAPTTSKKRNGKKS